MADSSVIGGAAVLGFVWAEKARSKLMAAQRVVGRRQRS
jgi:hypothetical protein